MPKSKFSYNIPMSELRAGQMRSSRVKATKEVDKEIDLTETLKLAKEKAQKINPISTHQSESKLKGAIQTDKNIKIIYGKAASSRN